MSTTSAPKHTNRLVNATSPYLLQHAHNPVDWYEWGPEALDRARKEDKPIFLSIGYSACHWCHVMERESFENDEVAAIMNAQFVNIKVDREERPDLDDIYMTATQVFTQSGGWPMSVWLTPDQRPFYAGTYFPPDSRYGRPGFKDVLNFLAQAWKDRRDDITKQADAITDAVRQIASVEHGGEIPGPELITKTAYQLSRAFDPVNGGITGGGTNKFPPSMAMDVMLRAYQAATAADKTPSPDDARLLERVEKTLEKMAYGGIYDQLAGGIARYSTDTDWLVPHFEKMLYDQALVSDIYLKGYQLTGKPLYARVAAEIYDYVIADLQSGEGGFYSTRDADSEGVEGKYYVWSKKEIVDVLGEADAALFCDYYDVSDTGNWEGHNILRVVRPVETLARIQNASPGALERQLAASRKKLLDVRAKRVPPHLDDKILASWNGLMIASLARGSRILGQPRYREAAARAANFVLSKMTRDGRLQRTYRNGKTHTLGYLDDHAFMIEGLLNLYEADFDIRWLDKAAELNKVVLQHFKDEAGGFFFTASDAEKILLRSKDASDGAIPSGNSVQLMNLLRLAVLLDDKSLATEAERMLTAFGGQLAEAPVRSERLLCALDFYRRRPKEIAFVAKKTNLSELDPLIDAAVRMYIPNLVMARLVEDAPDAAVLMKRVPLLAEKKTVEGRPAAYVCLNFSCRAPVTEAGPLRRELGQ